MLKRLTENKSTATEPRVRPGQRLWIARCGTRLVPEGDPEALVLYCTERDEVPRDLFRFLTREE